MYSVVTTFPNSMFNVYARDMLTSFTKYWPSDIALLVELDNEELFDEVGRLTRPQDAIAVGWDKDHEDFVKRNQDKDDPKNYRKQVTRFCHKVFAIKRAYESIKKAKAEGIETPRYLIWMDADVITTGKPDLTECLPNEGEAVSYLGRKDWPHSECGWLAFDLENDGGEYIDVIHGLYTSDEVLRLDETHDSWVFDFVRKSAGAPLATNLTPDKPGMDIWPLSPMGKWSTHYKGPQAKQEMQTPMNVKIQTRNAIPHEEIRGHISENQKLIKNWIRPCEKNEEEIVIVSAGPQLIAEDVLEDYKNGKKIIAVKHAMGPLKAAGIKPWACMLLDPRPHVYDFVQDPDPEILWFVASQVNPKVTAKLLAHGCTVWGYHAAVGADEGELTSLQHQAVVHGGSATATRGWFVLRHLGFYKFKLYGYDLCLSDKPNLNETDELGQPKYLEISIGLNHPLAPLKKCFWSKPELVAQFEEINNLVQGGQFQLEAVGDGIVPFILKQKRAAELRQAKLNVTLSKPVHYGKLLKWNSKKKTNLSTWLRRILSKIRQKMKPSGR